MSMHVPLPDYIGLPHLDVVSEGIEVCKPLLSDKLQIATRPPHELHNPTIHLALLGHKTQ